MSTIYALSTSTAKAAIAVIRISGPQASSALQSLTAKPVRPRQAHLRKLWHKGRLLDEALVLHFPLPASFTGEDCVELQCHGGRAVTRAVLDALASLPGLRYAEPGEFSKRAFRAGRLDLTQAEALADLINAETEQQRRQAIDGTQGALGERYAAWRQQLIDLRALLEAVIDFGEDNALDTAVHDQVTSGVVTLQARIKEHLEASVRGERLRQGISVALFGPPNAGKSSLLNLLCRRDASIVSSEAGTTRDVVETTLDIGGYPVILCDTAGLRETTHAVEQEGIRRAKARVEAADLRICVQPAGEPMDTLTASLVTADTMLLLNKIDVQDQNQNQGEQQPKTVEESYRLSCHTQEGFAPFLAALQKRLQVLTGTTLGPALGATARHREQCTRCLDHLEMFLQYEAEGFDFVLGAEELRYAGDCLGRILGRIDVEEVLGVIFRDFCIGK